MSTMKQETAEGGAAQAEGFAAIQTESESKTITGCVPITSTPSPSEAARNESVKWVFVLSVPANGSESMTFAESPRKVFTTVPSPVALSSGQTEVVVSTVISSSAIVGTGGALQGSIAGTGVWGAVLIRG